MRYSVRTFAPGDEYTLVLCDQQANDFEGDSLADAIRLLAANGPAFVLEQRHGPVLAIAGVASIQQGLGYGWAFMSGHSARHMRWVTRTVRQYLDDAIQRHRRIEIVAREQFVQAVNWAYMLGFELEGTARALAPDGADMLRFARVNPDWKAS